MSTDPTDFKNFLNQWEQANQPEDESQKRRQDESSKTWFDCDYCKEKCFKGEKHMPNPYHCLPFMDEKCPNVDCDYIFATEASEDNPYCPDCKIEFPHLPSQGSFCSRECAKGCALYEVCGIAGGEIANLIDKMSGCKIHEAPHWSKLEQLRNDGTGVTREDWDSNMTLETSADHPDCLPDFKKKK